MKKLLALVVLLTVCAGVVTAQNTLSQTLPLLQQTARTPRQTQQVLNLFRSSQDPNTIFAAGASLVKIPPESVNEPALLNQIISAQDPLKMAFSAIILTSMGSVYEELIPLLQDTLQSADPVLRAYGATAYTLINPDDKTHTTDVIRLYIFDSAFAQRAMNLVTKDSKEQFNLLKTASSNPDTQVRSAAAAWLGTLHTPEAAAQLQKRAKKETDMTVQTQLAIALAANPDVALEQVTQGLKLNYKKPAATTYALALGFMTGNSVSTLKEALLSTDTNQHINALRSAAYMAGILANPDGFAYSSDRTFDTHLLKGLIAPISALAKNGSSEEQTYAQNALEQIEKLL